jgi:hypothetical protein
LEDRVSSIVDLDAEVEAGVQDEGSQRMPTGEQGAGSPEAESVPDEAPEKPPIDQVADHVRSESHAVRLTDPAVFLGEPFSLSEEELAGIWTAMEGDVAYRDIVHTKDERTGTLYVHSKTSLSQTYAKLMLLKEADDPMYMIAETVRDESRIYPRPTRIELFGFKPFNLTKAQAYDAVQALPLAKGYEDVKSFETSSGATYLFSDRYLEERVAREKAELQEDTSR